VSIFQVERGRINGGIGGCHIVISRSRGNFLLKWQEEAGLPFEERTVASREEARAALLEKGCEWFPEDDLWESIEA